MKRSTTYSQFRPSASTSAGNLRCEPYYNRGFQLSNQVAFGSVLTVVPGGK